MTIDAAGERRALRAYEAAIDWPAEEREARLDRLLEQDATVREVVRAMFRAEGAGASLATEPPRGDARYDIQDVPDRVGPYRIGGELGRGGMGAVYLGTRVDGDFDQQVAIKLMRPGLFAGRALEQFASERRILARLHHPHVAQLLDGGVAENGASYIVMELLDGKPITEHADAAALPVSERLDLFCEMCGAIDHAHRNLIVHSDIKPSNVVVVEGFGVKLLDFGIARILGALEASGPSAHTPGFGSPAQAAGLAAAPADDIFAIGRLLHALLGLHGDADLRAIADKAAAIDPAARYGAVGELTADIARWRQHRPVTARRGGRWHEARLYWRRHRVAIPVVALILMLLVATAVISSVLYLRASRARIAAEQRFEQTRSLSRYLIDDVTRALAPLPGSTRIRQQIAERANRTLEDLSRVAGASPQLRAESAEAFSRVGSIMASADLTSVADPAAADRALRRAESELRRLEVGAAGGRNIDLALVRVLIERARFVGQVRNEPVAALCLLDEADRRLRSLAGPARGDRALALPHWDAALARAAIADGQGDFAANLRALPALIARYRAIPLPHDAERALRLEQSWTLLASSQWYSGDQLAALSSYRAGLAALLGPGLATDARVGARQAYAAFNIASTLGELGRPREAVGAAAGGVAAINRLRNFDDSPAVRNIENIVTLEYATDLAATRRFAEATAFGWRSMAGRRALAALQPRSYAAVRSVPVGLRPLAEVLFAAGEPAAACAALHDADASWERIARTMPLSRFDANDERGVVRRLLKRCPNALDSEKPRHPKG